MWLLDANMPVQLVALLKELAIEADTAVARGWNTLANGALVRAAANAGFTVLLTRDRLLGEAAAAAPSAHPDFCIVTVRLPQLRAVAFLQAFPAAWNKDRITPASGRLIEWP